MHTHAGCRLPFSGWYLSWDNNLQVSYATNRALDTLHAILTSHTVYFYSIKHFGDAEALTKITWCVFLDERVIYGVSHDVIGAPW